MIHAVACMDLAGLIGIDHELPWNPKDVPADQWRYRRLTYGYPVIMGNRTYEGIGPVGKNRRLIVLSKDRSNATKLQRDSMNDKHEFVSSIQEALNVASEVRSEMYTNSIVVAGGSSVFNQTIDLWDCLHLTIIHHVFRFDPELVDPHYMPTPLLNTVNAWVKGDKTSSNVRFRPFHSEEIRASGRNKYDMTFIIFARR